MKNNGIVQVALKMMKEGTAERKEAEKMMGKRFEEMTQEQRRLAAEMLFAFDGIWNKN